VPEEIVRVNPKMGAGSFIQAGHLSFQHLDWVSPYLRLEQPGCLVLIADGEIKALISIEPENPPVAWIRLFVCLRDGHHAHYFSQLLQRSLPYLKSKGVNQLYTLSLAPWVEALFTANGFSTETHIITLKREIEMEPAQISTPESFSIRPMTVRDLDTVHTLDEQAFPPAWQMNRLSLQHAYQDSNYCTVAIAAGRIVGYQMSTSTFSFAHLARLAVAPEAQHQHIGSALVQNVFMDCFEKGITTLSVNTQSDNTTSLKFYQNLGFQREGKLIPVYRKDL